MKRHSRFLFLLVGSCVFLLKSLSAQTISVTDSTDTCPGVPAAGSLRAALLSAQQGNTISFNFPAGPTPTMITLAGPLPAIVGDLTITTAAGSNAVTIDGNSSFQPFSMANGTLIMNANLVVQNGLSKGGDGGNAGANTNGGGGGGGGAGGGGGLYVHTGATVILSNITLGSITTPNTARGGNGGNIIGTGPGGGGGGGFGCNVPGGNNSGKGGNASGTLQSGAGGGGHTAGGNGGVNASGSSGGLSLNTFGGGAGGGAGQGYLGAPVYGLPGAQLSFSGGGGGGGGGAGLGGNGGSSSSSSGGVGGIGLGTDNGFGGGGGGGGGAASAAAGGSGTGAGGGGGSDDGLGGAGGLAGGGGGGGGGPPGSVGLPLSGGTGGFGAGGGGCWTNAQSSVPGASLFGGGSGGQGIGGGGGGGGGAAMGGNLFIHTLAQVTIGDNVQIINGQYSAGTGGTGGVAGDPGGAYGPDIFIASGATLTFTNTDTFTVYTNIESNQGVVGLNPLVTTGGLIMNGTGILNLAGNLGLEHTYTATTKILQGTVQISTDTNLGSLAAPFASNPIVIQNGTLNTIATLSSSRPFSFTASNATINTNASTTCTLLGLLSGSSSLTKTGLGTLYLNPATANTYNKGTIVSQGILQISAIGTADSALGPATTQVTLQDQTTFNTIDPGGLPTINSIRPFVLGGQASFQIDNTTTLLSGNITGSGQLVKTGLGTLALGGNNSYTASGSFTYGTDIQQGTLVGNSSSLQGNINIGDGTTLIFLQAAAGTYSGSLTSGLLNTGVLQIGNATLSPFPLLTISGSSPDFLGTTHIFPSGVLSVTGSLANSPFLIDAGGFLKGTGIVGSTTSSGTIAPGGSIGELTINGNLVLNPTSNLEITISPTTSSLLQVLGNAALNGTLSVISDTSGFFGLGNSYTILTNTGTQSGTFVFVNSDPNFTSTVTYLPHSVILNLKVDQPFLNFPYNNPNEESVGENLDALVASGALTGSSPLGQAINSLANLSNATINNALDQMHPAAFSAFSELQAAVGGQLLTMFHRRPVPYCVCSGETRFWVQPYGNWLKEKNVGYELGFNANLKGAAVGFDTEITEGWTVGIGFTWNKTHLQWRKGRGNASIQGYYGAAYTDYSTDNFYIGLSCLQGFDNCKSSRHINFSTVHEEAHATRSNRETIGQLALAAFFGPGACFAFPYLNVDYFYLKEHAVHESGAPGLNLSVREHSQSTLRTEAGFAVQVQDTNKNNTMCVAPLFGLGWAMELPLRRPPYKSNFEGQTIPFDIQGWDYTWQLFTLRFGFTITYKCVSIYGGYLAEMSPLETTPFFDQRGDIRLEISW